jgi:putative chitinase
MPGAARLGDKSKCDADVHGKKCCPHSVEGPATEGSPNVFINGKKALRKGDKGVHSTCCGKNEWAAKKGSPVVFINGISAIRIGDGAAHCGGMGNLIEGSENVFIGDKSVSADKDKKEPNKENFSFDFTEEKLDKCLKRNKNIPALYKALCDVLPQYEINTESRVAAFLAQCGHESVDFTILKENLNYSAQSLTKVWPKRFPTLTEAQPYHRKPEKIANKVYANRMSNGDEASGEGWLYRGRGAIQLTGKYNYSKFAADIQMTLEKTVSYIETLEGAIESACWFWSKNNLNVLADKKDVKTMTKRINGGNIGLEERKQHMIHNINVFKESN